MRKKTKEEFVRDAISVHGDIYDYSKTIYVNAITKVTVICKDHGEFYVRPYAHVSGKSGCNICGFYKSASHKKKTTKEFVKEAKIVHGDKYDYTETIYTTAKNKVKIKCPTHGDFFQIPYSHLNHKECCPDCYIDFCRKLNKDQATEQLERKFNGLVQPDDHKLIPLGNDRYAIVDNEDFDKVRGINWYYDVCGYAGSKWLTRRGQNDSMHRFLMNPPEGYRIDHIDGDGLNNRRSNLRICTASENSCNVRKRKGTTSIYKGVTWSKSKNRWCVSITKNRKTHYVGVFMDEHKAGEAYNEAAKKHHKEFAKLNIIKNR